MNHKVTSNRLATSINYMSWGFNTFEEHIFLGWLETSGDYHWGIELDGVPHVAVHLFRTPEGFYWGDDEDDTAGYAASHPYVIMFYGSDNSSCFKRFRSKKTALEEWAARKSISWDELGVLFYNS